MEKQKLKVKAYIDGANMFYTQKKLGWNLDWVKIKNYFDNDQAKINPPAASRGRFC